MMNKRIKELAKQASFEETTMTNFIAGPRQIFYGDEAHIQKFAELIVRECAGLFPNVYVSIENDYVHTPVIASDYIKKHFGVEE